MPSFPRRVTKPFTHPFTVSSTGLYAISVTATCRSGAQTGQYGGEDLRVEIDDIALREVPPVKRKQEYNIPPAWNGTQLQGLPKTVIFITRLIAGDHKLVFIPYRAAEILAEPKIDLVENVRSVAVITNQQADDGNRRPWQTIALINLPLVSITLDATAQGHWRDSDDLKIIVDNTIKSNPNKLAILRRDWLLSGSLLKRLLRNERQQFTFEENLPSGVHYIELWADRRPTVHALKLDLGEITDVTQPDDEEPEEGEEKRIPTVDDPRWTGDFRDDIEQIILARAIFGEARNVLLSDQARIGVAWSIRHRVEDNRWGDTYNTVITQPWQYSAFNERDDNYDYVKDPLRDINPIDARMWRRCHEIAGQVMHGEVEDPTRGANHYHDISTQPHWTADAAFLVQIDTLRFYRL